MKILDVLKVTIPNAFKDKNPKKVVYKKGKSNYGSNGPTDGTGATDGASSGGDGGAGGGQ